MPPLPQASLKNIVAFFLCAFGGLIIFQSLSLGLVAWLTNTPYEQLIQIGNQDTWTAIIRKSWLASQAISLIGGFILLPIVYVYLTPLKTTWNLKSLFQKPPQIIMTLGLVIGMSIAGMIVNAHVIHWNQNWQLPNGWHGIEQWMQSQENKAQLLTQGLTVMDNLGDLAWVMIVMAVVPAVAEEFFFRGLIQPQLQLLGAHAGIWITALIFSFFHLQFYGLVPRMLLGAFFGYLFWYSSSLWLPILGHFLNNALVCVGLYLQIPEQRATSIQTILAIITFVGLLLLFLRLQRKKPKKGWETVATTRNEWEATLICDKLTQNDIPAVVMKQKDSLYLIGYFKVYVPLKALHEAQALLADTQNPNKQQ